jgi:hypothetical protein
VLSAHLASSTAAAIAISSLIVTARESRVPRKIPGNTRESFTWLLKSLRPVATIRAPASFASHGQISGFGVAHANTIASLAIERTQFGSITPGPDELNAMHTSAPLRASATLRRLLHGSFPGKPPTSPGTQSFAFDIATVSVKRLLGDTSDDLPGSIPYAFSRRKLATFAAPIPIIAILTVRTNSSRSCVAGISESHPGRRDT